MEFKEVGIYWLRKLARSETELISGILSNDTIKALCHRSVFLALLLLTCWSLCHRAILPHGGGRGQRLWHSSLVDLGEKKMEAKQARTGKRKFQGQIYLSPLCFRTPVTGEMACYGGPGFNVTPPSPLGSKELHTGGTGWQSTTKSFC